MKDWIQTLTCRENSMSRSDAIAFWISIAVVLFVALD